MTAFEEQVLDCCAALEGPCHDDAYHRLLELGPQVIPLLEAHFRNESGATIRSTLVNIAWRVSAAAARPFLAEALRDADPRIWKEALDGLASSADAGALQVLQQARAKANVEQMAWFDEAIQQATFVMGSKRRHQP